MHPSLPSRHLIRLPRSEYARPGAICSVTVGVKERAKIFARPDVAGAAVDVLKDLALSQATSVFAYCVMPDHVHLVLAPSEGCDVVTFVGRFKNVAQRSAWRLGVRGPFWQRSFWDRFLREEDDLDVAMRYVLENPVRAGLVRTWREYPHAGSLTFDLS